MIKRALCLSMFVLFSLSLIPASAEEGIETLKLKMKEVKGQIKQTQDNYKKDVSDITTLYANKLNTLKKEFHKQRSTYLAEKKEKLTQRESDFNNHIQPLKAERQRIRQLIEPTETNNFAK